MIAFQPGQPILHAYILTAADPARREENTRSLAAAMLCTSEGVRPCGQCRDCRKVFGRIHPDVILVEPDPGAKRPELKVDQIRDVVADAYVMPSEAQRKVYVFHPADLMNLSAQNALLKLLEEPPRSAAFVLSAERAEALLPTVRSRCELLREQGDTEQTVPKELLTEAETYLRAVASDDRLARLRWCRSHENDEPESVRQLLCAVLRRLTEHLAGERALPGLDAAEALRLAARIERCLEYLRANVGLRQLFGLLSVPTNLDQN